MWYHTLVVHNSLIHIPIVSLQYRKWSLRSLWPRGQVEPRVKVGRIMWWRGSVNKILKRYSFLVTCANGTIIIHRNSKHSLCLFYLNDMILEPFTLLLDSSLKEGQRSGWKSSWFKDQSMVARRWDVSGGEYYMRLKCSLSLRWSIPGFSNCRRLSRCY